MANVKGGIGIINFLKHKNYFITGATGFIAKVFVEKLLREVPEVQKIYLLMRAKNSDDAQQRLKSIIDCEVFKKLREVHGEKYEEFMRSKLVAVIGNVCEPGLGMQPDVASVIAERIDVVINSAGNTKWHERYDVLLDVNVRGLSRLLHYAMDCKKLILLLHVSTAYVTREIEGDILEKPITMDKSTANKQNSHLKEMDIDAEFTMVEQLASSGIAKNKITLEMSKLGLKRAKYHGWTNTYQLTKAMGEALLSKLGDKLPTVIIRPPFITSSFKEPFSGWVEGYRGMDPMIVLYGQGHLQGLFAEPTTVLDVVPIDIVVNAMIAAIAYHGIIGKSGLYVYNVASSMENPLVCENLFKYCRDYFTLHPLKNSKGDVIKIKDIEYYTSFDEYIMFGLDSIKDDNKLHGKLVRMAALFGTLMFGKVRFINKNTQNLFYMMSPKEKELFDFDVKSFEWKDYFSNIHVSGLREHVLKHKLLPPRL